MSRLSIGDTLFNKDGRPAVVVGKKDESGALIMQREGPEFEATRRRGYINGLPPQTRPQFNEIIDAVNGKKDPKEKVAMLHEKIGELKVDPRNHMITRYLEGELAYIMNSSGITPREYATTEFNLK